MVIGWSLAMFMFSFVDQKYSKETRGPKVSKRVCPATEYDRPQVMAMPHVTL
jgi:hypothetical protein